MDPISEQSFGSRRKIPDNRCSCKRRKSLSKIFHYKSNKIKNIDYHDFDLSQKISSPQRFSKGDVPWSGKSESSSILSLKKTFVSSKIIILIKGKVYYKIRDC